MPEPDPELESIREKMMKHLLSEHAKVAPPASALPVPDHPVDVTTSEFDAFITRNETAVVDLWAPWCVPCRTTSPIVADLAKLFNPKVAFAKVNVDSEPGVAQRYGIEGIPTILGFLKGRLAGRWTGVRSRAEMEGLIRHTLLGETSRIQFKR